METITLEDSKMDNSIILVLLFTPSRKNGHMEYIKMAKLFKYYNHQLIVLQK